MALEGRTHGARNVVVLRDVTELRRMEEELVHLRRVESVGFLTSSVVHDFNNVLTAIVCSSALLSREVNGQQAASAIADDIRSAAERAAGLVRQIHTLLRRETVPAERISLSATVAEMRGLVELVVGKGVDLEVELDPDLPDTTVVREQLDQVILNLAANARDAMPRGGKLRVTTANVKLGEHSAAADCPEGGAYVALTVADTGEGMSPEVRERIFERFFTTKDAAKGTGLGLAAAHRFAVRSGGCISVRSAQGQGTTVVVYLPQSPSQGRVIPLARVDAEPPGGSETIVVVDADDRVRGAVRAVLKDRGYRVIDAPSGELALRQVELSPEPVHLVLADATMLGLGGRAVVERLRQAAHPAKLLLMSGHSDRVIADHGVAGEPLLKKVFAPSDLARRVREVLDVAEQVTPAAGERR